MINGVNSNTHSSQISYSKENKPEVQSTNRGSTDESGVILDIGSNDTKSTVYKKPTNKLSTEDIDKLWEKTQKATESLRQLVRKLIERQGKNAGDILSGKDVLNVDAQASAEAGKMISEDGDWGIDAVSSRIVDFAKAISGGDKGKFEELKGAIEKGFRQAKEALGGSLPDICEKTYDEVMKKLDAWANTTQESE